ncbi:MAG TPA: tRNA (adenine-N1)-methyltransferase [Candidatus Caldiarchaeum subterraneum]|uniref:tRNA (Adenine-N1)-methyltransferase n=1 Tax=Caldiarchaeum subterraneum TaxID=311458 RepID=A0A833EAE3_CALS0|nr:tRNA (adenine-N1)-methyltransferase [Candidatus Caldarchaeum subterraneum]
MSVIHEEDEVIILTEKGKRYSVKVVRGRRFHSSEGFIELSSLIGKPYGCVVTSNTGARFVAFKPTLVDIIMHLPRITQIVYPKDLGYIILHADVKPGSRVIEAGTGSAALTIVLASYVKPDGHVYSYDIKQEYLSNADKHLSRLGLKEYVDLKQRDVTAERFDECDVDTVILDLPEPWKVVEASWEALKPSGRFLSLSPTVEQVVETVESLKANGFGDIQCIELMQRYIRAKRGMTRPEFIMRGHTAYIVTARKQVDKE